MSGLESKEVMDALIAIGAKQTPVVNSINANGFNPFAIIPANCRAEDLSDYFPQQRIAQQVKLLEVGSFIAYVNRYSTPDTLIFANVTDQSASFVAVFDYHKAAPDLIPAHLTHRAQFDTLHTTEFKTWLAANNKRMTQVEFATWLEDNAKLFTEPVGADLLELVQTLYGKQDVRFNSSVRLQSGGSKLHFDEDVELGGTSKTTSGMVELPKEVTAVLPVFQGGAPYAIRARLKYRIESRKLALWFETIALHEITRHAIMSLVSQIARAKAQPEDADSEALFEPGTGIIPLLGSPQ
jgi:uncharacterized protein YfdQ (DUF2303 family)